MEAPSGKQVSIQGEPEIIVTVDELSRQDVTVLLTAHFNALDASNKAHHKIGRVLDLSALRHPSFTIFTARSAASNELMGCAALKEISPACGELKSMRTAAGHQRKGVAVAIMKHILEVAKARAYKQLRLETGAREEFAAARALYVKFGFVSCDPFEGYEDAAEVSVFMTYDLY